MNTEGKKWQLLYLIDGRYVPNDQLTQDQKLLIEQEDLSIAEGYKLGMAVGKLAINTGLLNENSITRVLRDSFFEKGLRDGLLDALVEKRGPQKDS